jgi:hypothetical protein
MTTLSTLLPLWADAAPDECREAGCGWYYLAAVFVHVHAPDDVPASRYACALVLGAVYVAAAARRFGFVPSLYDTERLGMECSASVWPEGAPYPIHGTSYTADPTEALRLVTVGALSCYLRALDALTQTDA